MFVWKIAQGDGKNIESRKSVINRMTDKNTGNSSGY